MLPFVEHNCGDSKLKCIDCEGQICPKCMVQCPVGNRCPKCTKRFTSHVLQIDFWTIMRGLVGGMIVGFLFGLLQILCPLGGFYILFFVYFLGVLAGNLVFKIAGRKIGRKMATVAVGGAVIGSFCFLFLTQSFLGTLLGQADNQDDADAETYQSATISSDDSNQNKIPTKAISENNKKPKAIDSAMVNQRLFSRRHVNRMPFPGLMEFSPISLSFIVFLIGLVSPFLGWSFSWPGLRR